MRSIKLPVVPHSESSVPTYEKFIANVRADCVHLMGPLQWSDWLHGEQIGNQPHSLSDFYLDSLRAGIVFAADAARSVQDVLAPYAPGASKRTLFTARVRERHPELAACVDIDALYKFCFSDSRTKTGAIFLTDADPALVKRYLPIFESWRTPEVRKPDAVLEFIGALEGAAPFPHTAVLLPDVPLESDARAVALVEGRRAWVQTAPGYAQYALRKKDERLPQCLGLSNSASALSDYFNNVLNDLRDGGASFQALHLEAVPAWRGKEEDLRARIAYLVESARKVPAPALAANWHDYRTSFAGKVESWVSNLERQKQEIHEQLFGDEAGTHSGHRGELDALRNDPVTAPEVHEIANACIAMLEALRAEMSDATLSLYRSTVGALRTALNENRPAPSATATVGKPQHEKYKLLHHDIKLIPQYPGETKRAQYRKLRAAPTQVKLAVQYLAVASAQLEKVWSPRDDDDRLLRVLHLLRRKYFALNGTRAQHIVRSALKPFLFTCADVPLALDVLLDTTHEDTYYLYRSVHARARNGFRVSAEYRGKGGKPLAHLVDALTPRWDDLIEAGDINDLLDACELEKIRFGLLVEYAPEQDYRLQTEALPVELFAEAHAFQGLLGARAATRAEYGRFIQSTVLSELRGALSKMSRCQYTERYVVQIVGSSSAYPLCRVNNAWCLALGKVDRKGHEGVETLQKEGRSFSTIDFKQTVRPATQLLSLQSSKYQIQFLKKALGDEASWWNTRHQIGCESGEYSFIVEVPMHITWDLARESVSIEEVSDERNQPRAYISLPFTLTPSSAVSGLATGARTRYMGIDVGEFGLAWTVLELQEDSPRVLAHGFIHERLTRTIRDFRQVQKNKQMRGTFGMPSTKLERLRENAITTLRNQVHAIAVRYKAIPVYERQISAFETGSNRVVTIYDSVKRADLGRAVSGTDAEKAEAKHVWGDWKGKGNVGKQVDAFGTSYQCTRCGYCPYEETDPVVMVKHKLTARPSTEDERVKRMGLPLEWRERRGNSAVYICPNETCGHVSDADMQASYWIALKSALSDLRYGQTATLDEAKKKILPSDLREAHMRRPTVITLTAAGETEYAETPPL